MAFADLIRRKRDGGPLSRTEIERFVRGVVDGSVADYQASALLMAIYLRGMTDEETAALTMAMVDSGARVDLRHLRGTPVDKHSTGGVGDKTSLVLAPLAAACGAVVPMMSGRALGHTGGTLDKLEAIPGFRTDLSLAEFRAALEQVGCALIGQTAEVAPADKALYALRDVTATIESVPLITASIMSKKIAEGISALVLDVKAGRGAFMRRTEDARVLARALVRTGRANHLQTEALLTAMDRPLGRTVGNALEVAESLDTLKGRGPADLEALSIELAARMVRLAGAAPTDAEARALVGRALASGAGLEKFREIVEHQGGDPRVIDDPGRLPRAPGRHIVRASRRGVLTRVDAEFVGRASMALGAGRGRVGEPIDPSVGLVLLAEPGDVVGEGDGLLEIHYRDETHLAAAEPLAADALEIGEAAPPAPLILEVVA